MRLLKTYLGSNELKKVIVKRSIELNIPFRFICHEIGVEYRAFMQTYINSSTGDSSDMTEEQFEGMLEILGIETRFQFVLKSNFVAQGEKLKEKYESAKQKKTSFTIHK